MVRLLLAVLFAVALVPADSSAQETAPIRVGAALDDRSTPLGKAATSAIGKHYIGAALFANTAWVAGHRDLIERFDCVLLEADRYAGAHESETIPLIAQFVGMDPGVLSKMHHPGRATYRVPSEVPPPIDLAAEYTIISKGFPAQQMICDCALEAPRS